MKSRWIDVRTKLFLILYSAVMVFLFYSTLLETSLVLLTFVLQFYLKKKWHQRKIACRLFCVCAVAVLLASGTSTIIGNYRFNVRGFVSKAVSLCYGRDFANPDNAGI